MPNASDRRSAAIDELLRKINADVRPVDIIPTDELCKLIAPLAKLGRTQRWLDAVQTWQDMVRQHAPGTERPAPAWAWIQGSIWACHAA